MTTDPTEQPVEDFTLTDDDMATDTASGPGVSHHDADGTDGSSL